MLGLRPWRTCWAFGLRMAICAKTGLTESPLIPWIGITWSQFGAQWVQNTEFLNTNETGLGI